MDFFAAEGRAKKRTTRLLVLFGFAVAGTVVAGYLATVLALQFAHAGGHGRAYYGQYGAPDDYAAGRSSCGNPGSSPRSPRARWP